MLWLFTPPERLSVDESYERAKPRFTTERIDVNGVPHVRMSDPLLGVHAAIDARAPYRWIFREHWKSESEKHRH